MIKARTRLTAASTQTREHILLAGERLAWALALLGGAKLVAEYLGLSLPWMAPDAAVVTEAHLFGAAAGLLCGGWFGRRGGSRALFRNQ